MIRIPLKKVMAISVGASIAILILAIKMKSPSGKCQHGDCKNGRGKMIYSSGEVYEGDFKAGSHHGKGVYSNKKGDRFEGDWLEGKRHGYGVYLYSGGAIYEGGFVENRKEGRGRYTWPDGTQYFGQWNNSEPEGTGELLIPGAKGDRQILKGKYRKGVIYDGEGVFIYPDGKRYIGQWEKGQRQGKGMILDDHGKVIASGIWTKDKLQDNKKE